METNKVIFNLKFKNVKTIHQEKDTSYTILKPFILGFTDKNGQDIVLPILQFNLVGYFPSVFEEDEFIAKGYFSKDKFNKDIFKVIEHAKSNPQTIKGIKYFLINTINLTAQLSEKIVRNLGESTLTAVIEDYTILIPLKISPQKAKKIYNKIKINYKFTEIFMFVMDCGLNYKVALEIYKLLGNNAMKEIKANPYSICEINSREYNFNEFFLIAEKIAFRLNFPADFKPRVYNSILYFLHYSTKYEGNLFNYKDNVIKEINKIISKASPYKGYEIYFKDVISEIEKLKKDKKVVVDSRNGKEIVYSSLYHYVENQIIKLLIKHMKNTKKHIASNEQIESFIEKYEKDIGYCIANKQKEAVKMALTNGFSVLTGTPGTGKTFTVNTIQKCLKSFDMNYNIVQAAPTGKAARRLEDLTGTEAQTIHRLVGLKNDKDKGENVIAADLLVIDEASMIDAYLFFRLLEAVHKDTRILFVGDYNQLPPIGPGLILKDLIDSGKIPTTRLDEIFRQAQDSQIVTNSHKLIEGKLTTDVDGLKFDHKIGDFYFFNISKKDKIIVGIMKIIKDLISNKHMDLKDIQVLSPLKDNELGTKNLNMLIQQKFNPRSPHKTEIQVCKDLIFRDGDRVMQIKNNYDKDIFNGDVGLIKKITKFSNDEYRIEVDYDKKVVIYDEETINNIILSYAITVHKAQGSEFRAIIMPIDQGHSFALNKNLIYTAWTRAKDVVINLGQKDQLDLAVSKKDKTERNSMIKDKIIDAFKN